MWLFPLFAIILLAATNGLLRWGLGRGLFRPWMKWAGWAAVAHTAIAWAPYIIYGRDARYQAPGWFNALFTLPSLALTLSSIVTVTAAPMWVPWAKGMRARARRAAGAGAGAAAGAAAATAPATSASIEVAGAEVAGASGGITRRQLLRAAAVAPPAALVSSGPLGVFMTEAYDMPFVRRMELYWPDLAPALDGIRIAQVSDIHIGIFVDAPKLRKAMEVVQSESPDLFVVTGDVIDDLRQLDATMEALSHVRTPLGSYACLGNHEYYTGLRPIRSAYDRSTIHLLVNEGTPVKTAGGATIEVSAVDYPMGNGIGTTARSGGDGKYAANAERALVTRAPGGDFRLHLSHHPHGWDDAAARGAHLTLSGHTHGGQIAIGGRPLFGAFFKYMRGTYENRAGDRKLFVHSGLGHWMPLRINCPAEIAVITLRRGAMAAAAA